MQTLLGLNETGTRKSLFTALSFAAAIAAFTLPAQAMGIIDLQNGWTAPPSNLNPTGFEYDYQGDVRSSIPPQLAEATLVNPYYADFVLNHTAYNQISITYDSNANLTRVLLSGVGLPNPVQINGWPGPAKVVNGVGTYHTGLDQLFSNYAPLPPLTSKHWITGQGNFEVPALQVHEQVQKQGTKAIVKYAVIYVEANNRSVGTWTMTGVVSRSGKIPFEIVNNSAAPVTVGVIGYILNVPGPHIPATCIRPCAAEVEALGSLNDATYPSPDLQGSMFKVVKGPKDPLQPGQSFVFKAQ